MNADFRFEVGAEIMCNLGSRGWRLGRVIALNYREEHWPVGQVAPYQVLIEEDHTLIYVPYDDVRVCREATPEDLRIIHRADALAALPSTLFDSRDLGEGSETPHTSAPDTQLHCAHEHDQPGSGAYRNGRCHCCHCCPRAWSYVELYSERYRCAERNNLEVTRRSIDLGVVRVGDRIDYHPDEHIPASTGFMQSPTLARLAPGLRFSDDGALAGEIAFDPHRGASYQVDFVAVSTAGWEDPAVGLVRLELVFVVEGNDPPDAFDAEGFALEQQRARERAYDLVRELGDTWARWERHELSNRDTCDSMREDLRQLRALLERHPRLDNGWWWGQLGGFHMNIHKLLENALFKCELYLGYALTFGDAEVRYVVEQNLDGCYKKRELEAARYLWTDGIQQMIRGEWAAAAHTLRRAAAKKDGWGWAVNYGDIWISESAARLIHGATLVARDPGDSEGGAAWIVDATELLKRGESRANEAGVFGPVGHPWARELGEALDTFAGLSADGEEMAEWIEALVQRTVYWCAQVLGGAAPFPPKPRPRVEDAMLLRQRLPGHHLIER